MVILLLFHLICHMPKYSNFQVELTWQVNSPMNSPQLRCLGWKVYIIESNNGHFSSIKDS